MPQACLAARIDLRDQDPFAEVRRMSGPVIAAFGGHVLVRSSQIDQREGEQDFDFAILVEFPESRPRGAFATRTDTRPRSSCASRPPRPVCSWSTVFERSGTLDSEHCRPQSGAATRLPARAPHRWRLSS